MMSRLRLDDNDIEQLRDRLLAGPLALDSLEAAAADLAQRVWHDNQYRTLSGIQARTVVLGDGADPLTPAVHAEELATSIPHAEHLHLPRAGHTFPQEAPRVLNDALRRVIGAHDRSRCGVPA